MKMRPPQSKLVTVVGARPQFIKAAAVTPALKAAELSEVLVHTGQHYDWEMSASFFRGFNLPEPHYNLEVGSASHGAQTGRMLEAIESVLNKEKPGAVLVYGDTNSTLAGALAAAKLNIPIAHVEAGLRSFDREMPEEVNRVVADHLSSLLFAPTANAVENLRAEGITKGVIRTGDVMFDLFLANRKIFSSLADEVLSKYSARTGEYLLVTVHRAENTDKKAYWTGIREGISRLADDGARIIWPAHPRTRPLLEKFSGKRVTVTPPLPYLETQVLVSHAKAVLTDSGGLQKEAAFHGTPCVVLRDGTEWVELVEGGFAVLAGHDSDKIVKMVSKRRKFDMCAIKKVFGSGRSSVSISMALIREFFGKGHA